MRYPLIFTLLAAFTACKSQAPRTTTPDAQSAPVPAQADAGTGTIIGTVRLGSGWRLPPPPNMASDPYCARQDPPTPAVVVDGEGGLSNVVVSVADVLYVAAGPVSPDASLFIDQVGCGYEPRIAVSRVMKLVVGNSDVTMHNVHAYRGERTWFNIAQPPGAGRYERVISGDGIVKLGCDVHPWMAAYAHFFDHPYHALSVQGKFVILDVPAGERQLTFWHEVFGQKTIKVTVVPNAGAVVTFTFSPQD